MAEVSVPGACPNCHKRTLHRHCKDSVYCTWNECGTCLTLLDRRTGRFVARVAREKGAE